MAGTSTESGLHHLLDGWHPVQNPPQWKVVNKCIYTQLCVVHQIRNSCKYVSWKERKDFSADLKGTYGGVNGDSARYALNDIGKKWGSKYGYAITSWENNWKALTSYFDFPLEIRKLIYTTNVIESLSSGIRKFTNAKSLFHDEQAALKQCTYQ